MATVLPKLQEKVKCVRGERKLNFGNEITEILVLPVPKMHARGSARNGNQLWQWHCRKWEKKKILWQLSCYKWRGKKKCYVHNIFHNKLQMVSCYWFKFESNTKITFLPPIITSSNNLSLRICCKNIVKMLLTYHNAYAYTQIILRDCVMEKKKNIYIYIYIY